jgi:hypothetical protein
MDKRPTPRRIFPTGPFQRPQSKPTGPPIFEDLRQAIIDGIDSAQAEGTGWDALRASIPVDAVVRTSDTVVTITLPALATYDITALETLTATVPGIALTLRAPLVATPTFTIATAVAGVTGTGALVAGAAVVAASGVSASVSSSGALSAQTAAVTGAGVSASVATAAALAAQSATVTGAGASLSTGSGALAAQSSTVAAAGVSLSTGTGALAGQFSTVAAAGEVTGGVAEITGTGDLQAATATLSAVGVSESTGTGALAAQSAALTGTDAPPEIVLIDTHDGGGEPSEGYIRSWKPKDEELRRQLEELFERAENPQAREEIRAVVAPHVDPQAIADVARAATGRIPIVWDSLRSDAEAVRALLELYKQQAIAQQIADEVEEENRRAILLLL